mmetsp:Transcript_25640/g.44866  ORF Transcript_25640/g.44866 Transcript_25640/m.44866 type:complete len:745 (+) Transcript_25640:11-2245(+)
MEAKFLDSAHILALRTLFHSFSIEALGTMQTLTIANEEVTKLPPLTTLSVFRSLLQLNIRSCKLTSVPSVLIVKAFPLLTHIDLTGNQLTSVASVLPLGELKSLKSLNLLGNPLFLLEHRINLIQAIIFPEHKQHFKVSKCLSASYMSIPKMSRISQTKSARTFQRVVRKPAPVPREGDFPMLQVLCEEELMEDEMKSAKPYDDEVLLTPTKTISKSPFMARHRAKNEELLHNRAKFHPEFMRTSAHPCLERKQNIDAIPRYLRIDAVVVKSTEGEQSLSECSLQDEEESFSDVMKLYRPASSKAIAIKPAIEHLKTSRTEAPTEQVDPLTKRRIAFTDIPKTAEAPRVASNQRKRSYRNSILDTMDKSKEKPEEPTTPALTSQPSITFMEPPKKYPIEELKQSLDTVRNEQVKMKKDMEFMASRKLKFDHVAGQLYGPNHHLSHAEADRVDAILKLLNKRGHIELPSDQEIRLMLKEGGLDEERKEWAEQVMDLKTDLQAMHFKPESLEHWLAYVEKRQLELAEHQAIMALHKKRVFGDVRAKARERASRKLVQWQNEFIGKKAAPLAGIVSEVYISKEPSSKAVAAVHHMTEQFKRKQGKVVMAIPNYLPKVEYKGLLKECIPNIQDRMDAPRPLLKPMHHLEVVIKQHEEKMRDLEAEFDQLSAEDKLIAKVDQIKRNIANRERSRGIIQNALTQIKQMTDSFFAHQEEYYKGPEYDKKAKKKFKQRKDLLFTGSRFTIEM